MADKNESTNSSGIGLKIVVKDKDGNITAERCKDDDLFLLNWGLLVAGFLKYSFAREASGPTYIFHKTNGETATVQPTSYFYNGITHWPNGGRICLGGSSKAPTIHDYRLGSEILQIVPNLPALTNEGNVLKIIFTGTASFAGDANLAEVGLMIENPLLDNAMILVTRDTFDPVTVMAGGTITVQFEIWFNGMPA